MKAKSSVTIDDVAIPVDSQLLLQRLLATVKRDNSFALIKFAFNFRSPLFPLMCIFIFVISILLF